MTSLSPAPASLGLASPVLGPWFEQIGDDDDPLELPAPGRDLSCTITLDPQVRWLAPASGLLSWFVVTDPLPAPLAVLRQASGAPAFEPGALVVLYTLLPEVALRLGALAQGAPRPDSASFDADATTRPMITRLAMQIPPGLVTNLTQLGSILPDAQGDVKDAMAEIDTDAGQAAYLGLTQTEMLGNAPAPATVLRRPGPASRCLLSNTLTPIQGAKLWAFDRDGFPYDPGSLAALWQDMAERRFDNLWASTDAAQHRTVSVAPGRFVHLVNAHQGPLDPAIHTRINGQLTDLDPVDGSAVLFEAGDAPAITLTPAPDLPEQDTAPLPRLAPLPAGPYQPVDTATPFAGWTAPEALARDFQRIALTDLETLCTGLERSTVPTQADPRLRISPARNIAEPAFLPKSDAVAGAVMACFDGPEAQVQFIAPELDRLYGPQIPAVPDDAELSDDNWNEIHFTAHTLIGSGTADEATADGQSVVILFPESLPPGSWVRIWPHGRNLTTGRRFRMDGGAGLADGNGQALVPVALPNGQSGDGTEDVQFSFDMMISSGTGRRVYTDLRANRPPLDPASGALPVTALSADQTIHCPQLGQSVAAGAQQIPPGDPAFVIAGAISALTFYALDAGSLRPEDMRPCLANRADGSDRVITRRPAFLQTVAGDLPDESSAGGPERVHDSAFHAPHPGQDSLDFAAYDRIAHRGVIGAVAARAQWHEAPPAASAHLGVSAAPEIHGSGVAVAGPAADALHLLMRERAPGNWQDFIATLGLPAPVAPAVTTPGPWTALLETAAPGTHGHAVMQLIPPDVAPGLIWDNPDDPDAPGIRQRLDAALESLPGGLSVDALIDGDNFDDTLAARMFDRVLHKFRSGARQCARAMLGAVARAENLIWLQTPALCAERWEAPLDPGPLDETAAIDLIAAITERMQANPALQCLLILPKHHLPGRNKKLREIRKAAIQHALQELTKSAGTRVAWLTPRGGPGRDYHMSSTTLIVDDVIMVTGAAHGWRRGLTHDSALSAAVFDERLTDGRPMTVIAARRALAATLLGVPSRFVPETAPELVAAVRDVQAGGGFGRADISAFRSAENPISESERWLWNPGLRPGEQWGTLFTALVPDVRTEFEQGLQP